MREIHNLAFGILGRSVPTCWYRRVGFKQEHSGPAVDSQVHSLEYCASVHFFGVSVLYLTVSYSDSEVGSAVPPQSVTTAAPRRHVSAFFPQKPRVDKSHLEPDCRFESDTTPPPPTPTHHHRYPFNSAPPPPSPSTSSFLRAGFTLVPVILLPFVSAGLFFWPLERGCFSLPVSSPAHSFTLGPNYEIAPNKYMYFFFPFYFFFLFYSCKGSRGKKNPS